MREQAQGLCVGGRQANPFLALRIGALVAFLLASGSACSLLRDEAGGETISKSEYVQKANAICADANRRIRALGQPSGSIREQAALARQVNEITRSTVIRVSALPAPEADAPMLDALYRQALQAVRAGDRSTRAIERGDAAAANKAFARGATLIAEVNNGLAQYGLTECAR